MIRLLLALALPVLSLPALAAEWGHYINARYGYAVDIPTGFVPEVGSANGDGQRFRIPTATLVVYGANVTEPDFEAEVAQRRSDAAAGNWTITYAVSTPQRASFSARRGARILYARLIALCGGSQLAAFEFDYSVADRERFDPIVDHLADSLRPTEGACQ